MVFFFGKVLLPPTVWKGSWCPPIKLWITNETQGENIPLYCPGHGQSCWSDNDLIRVEDEKEGCWVCLILGMPHFMSRKSLSPMQDWGNMQNKGDQKVEGRARRRWKGRRKVDTIDSKAGRASVYHTELCPTEASTDFPGHTVISTCQLKFVSTASHSIRTMAFTVHLSSGSPTCYYFTCDLKYSRRPPRPPMHIDFTRDCLSSVSESGASFQSLLINK